MATDVGVPANFQYKFLRNDLTNGGISMPLTPPITQRRQQSVDSPLSRPRPRAGSDSNRYQRLSGNFQIQRESWNGSPKFNSARSSLGGEYNPFNSSPSSSARKSFGSFSDETNDVPNVKGTFTYQKLQSTSKTDDFDDWHFNQPNVFIDDSNDEVDTQRKTVETTLTDAPQYEVVSRFLCRHDDEIDLNVGDKIVVTAKYPDLWFQGTNLATGKLGIFPSLYVKEMPKPERELPKTEKDVLVSLNEDKPPVPRRLGSLNKQMTEPTIPSAKLEDIKTILEAPDETKSIPPRLTKPPVVSRIRSPQTSIRTGWTSLNDDKPTAGLDNPGYISDDVKKSNSPEFKLPAPTDVAKATSMSPTSPAVVSASDVVAKPTTKARSFSIEDTESDYSEVCTVNDKSLEWQKFGRFGELIKFVKLSSANLLRPRDVLLTSW